MCKAASFSQDDAGFYICNKCGTQSQDFVQEDSEVTDNGGGKKNRK
jgi:hypothetical protein